LVKLSIVIPTYNRLIALNQCLNALCNQKNVHESWQIVVVNDGGVSIESVVKNHYERVNIIHAEQLNSGPSAARNLAVKIAQGEIITFLDDDCIPHINWVSSILANSKKGVITGGKVTNWYVSNLYSESSQQLLDFLYQYNYGTSNEFFTSNNFSLFKSDFINTGGFSTSFRTSAGEDREFCIRAKSKGLVLHLNEGIEVSHAHYLTLNSFYRLHKKYGAAAYDYHVSMRNQNINVTKTPELMFYIRLIKFPYHHSKYSVLQKIKVSLLLMISQLAVAMGYFLRRLKAMRQ